VTQIQCGLYVGAVKSVGTQIEVGSGIRIVKADVSIEMGDGADTGNGSQARVRRDLEAGIAIEIEVGKVGGDFEAGFGGDLVIEDGNGVVIGGEVVGEAGHDLEAKVAGDFVAANEIEVGAVAEAGVESDFEAVVESEIVVGVVAEAENDFEAAVGGNPEAEAGNDVEVEAGAESESEAGREEATEGPEAPASLVNGAA